MNKVLKQKEEELAQITTEVSTLKKTLDEQTKTTEQLEETVEQLTGKNKTLTTENKQLHEKVGVLEPQLKLTAERMRFFKEGTKKNAKQQVEVLSTPSPTQ